MGACRGILLHVACPFAHAKRALRHVAARACTLKGVAKCIKGGCDACGRLDRPGSREEDIVDHAIQFMKGLNDIGHTFNF